MAIITDSYRTVFSTKQRENKSLQDYTRRFKTSREMLESHIGGLISSIKYIKTMPTYDDTDNDIVNILTDNASEQLIALLYLENANQNKYGSIMKNLNTQQIAGK